MKIWKLWVDSDNFEWFIPKIKWPIKYVQEFNGKSMSSKWKTIEVINAEPEKKLPLGNFINFYTHLPVIDEKTYSILQTVVAKNVEFLPIFLENATYYIMNVLDVLDCVDYEHSKFRRFKSSGRIMLFEKYAFISDKLQGHHIFKLIDEPLRCPCVSDEFRNACIQNGLTACKFELLWDSDMV